MYVKDDNGNKFPSLTKAAHAYGIGYLLNGARHRRLKTFGEVTIRDYHFTLVYEEADGEQPAFEKAAPVAPIVKAEPVIDPLLQQLRNRYSEKELEAIAKGEGLDLRKVDYPEIRLTGRHHRFVVISDTHIGSVYSPEEWHDVVAQFVAENDIEGVFHCGDLVDGLKIGRAGTQIYELSEIGYEAQKQKAVALLSRYTVPVYIISGNHDAYFKEFAGADIVQAVAEQVPNVTYIGKDAADIDIDGATVRLFHGGDGSSYATSYRLQKLVEAITSGHKPDILLAGHVHKFCYILERGIHAISVPCMQMQTAFMRGKKLAAHTGFLLLEFDVQEGRVRNLSLTNYPFYA